MPEENASAAMADGATTTGQTTEQKTAEGTAMEGGATGTNLLAEAKAEDGGQKTEDGKQKTEDGERKTEEKKGEEKAEDKKPEPKAPEEYAEFTVPEGTTLDEQTATEFKGLAKELDLTQEQAQKLLDFGGGKLRAQIEAPYKVWNEMQAKWQAEVKADPEIGGTKYEQSIKDAAQVFVPGDSNRS